ncbi:excalibur calcium-binding domain-containing protein [Tsuneonella deserti]|nr:excalibur calcium-binding domain-containing protein [Tsuneonella deserti]
MLPAAMEENVEKRAAVEASVHYAGCDEVRLLGKAPLYSGQPGYRIDMDGDGDGIACEPYR